MKVFLRFLRIPAPPLLRDTLRKVLATAGASTVAAGLVTVAFSTPAQASLTHVCAVQVTFRIGGDDLRANTTVQISAGGQSFTVAGGIASNTVASRTGSFPTCIPHSALSSGFTLTSISNPTWPQSIDNWNMDGVAFSDPGTGRLYQRRYGIPGQYIHRFTGQQPTWQTSGIYVDVTAPFLDRRYSYCAGDEMYARFVDPAAPTNPVFNVIMRRPGTTAPTVNAPFWGPPYFDWGISLAGLGYTVASSATVEFVATNPSGRTGTGVIHPGCDPIGLRL